MFAPAEILDALPVITSLVLIEGLLSVDNALAIAALASRLPKDQQSKALKLGILGAYLFRGLALFLVELVIANPWVKLVGAAYLLYLMASHLAEPAHEEGPHEDGRQPRPHGLWATVFKIEVMDLAVSLDNVVAAVALDQRFWVVCTGVFTGILALRFLAGWCIGLVERHPILKPTAFLLIGFVGVILSAEVISEMLGHKLHINSLQKFGGIVAILAVALLYDRSESVRRAAAPLVTAGRWVMVALNAVCNVVVWPVTQGVRLIRGLLGHSEDAPRD